MYELARFDETPLARDEFGVCYEQDIVSMSSPQRPLQTSDPSIQPGACHRESRVGHHVFRWAQGAAAASKGTNLPPHMGTAMNGRKVLRLLQSSPSAYKK